MQVSTHPGLEVSICLIKESRLLSFGETKLSCLKKPPPWLALASLRNRRVSCHDGEEVLLLIHMMGGWGSGETRAKHAAAVGGL